MSRPMLRAFAAIGNVRTRGKRTVCVPGPQMLPTRTWERYVAARAAASTRSMNAFVLPR